MGSYLAPACGIRWGGILTVLVITGFNLVEMRPLAMGVIFVVPLLLLAILLPLGMLPDSAFLPRFHWPLFAI